MDLESTPRDNRPIALFGTTFLYNMRKALGVDAWDDWIASELGRLDFTVVPGLRTLYEASRLEAIRISVEAQVGIARARSRQAGLFLRSECDVWLTVDDDNFAERGVLERLLQAARVTEGVVAAPYWLRQKREKLSFTTKLDGGPASYRCEGIELATAPDLSFGFGLVAMHRKAIEAVATHSPTFDDEHGTGYPAIFREYIQDRLWLGEDFAFCERARAAGVPLALLCDVLVEHDGIGCTLGMHEGVLSARRVALRPTPAL